MTTKDKNILALYCLWFEESKLKSKLKEMVIAKNCYARFLHPSRELQCKKYWVEAFKLHLEVDKLKEERNTVCINYKFIKRNDIYISIFFRHHIIMFINVTGNTYSYLLVPEPGQSMVGRKKLSYTPQAC